MMFFSRNHWVYSNSLEIGGAIRIPYLPNKTTFSEYITLVEIEFTEHHFNNS
jgi:hypothetical protein